jgi:hypothetical protein
MGLEALIMLVFLSFRPKLGPKLSQLANRPSSLFTQPVMVN